MNDSYKINIHESKKQKCTYKLCLLLGTLKNLEQAAVGELCFVYCPFEPELLSELLSFLLNIQFTW